MISSTEAISLSQERPILYYDGVCHLCNYWVRRISHDEHGQQYLFVALQSSSGQEMLEYLSLPTDIYQSVILVYLGQIYQRSDVPIMIADTLDGKWKLLKLLKIIPKTLRDWGYELVARYRYQWFGQSETCELPPMDQRDQFII